MRFWLYLLLILVVFAGGIYSGACYMERKLMTQMDEVLVNYWVDRYEIKEEG